MAEPQQLKPKPPAQPTATQEKPKPKPAPIATPSFVVSVGPLAEDEGYMNVMLYGDYGVGKTWLASSAQLVPEMRRVIYLNAEAGVKSLVSSDIVRIKITTLHQINHYYEWARRYTRARDAKNEDKMRELCAVIGIPFDWYYTTVIDSLSEIQTYIFYQLLGVDFEKTGFDEIPASPEFAEWTQSFEMLKLMVRKFRDLPMHTIIVLGEQEVEVGKAKRLIKRPNLSGRKLPGEVQGFFDVVGYLQEAVDDKGKTQRRLYLRKKDEGFKAKNRFKGNPPNHLDNPTMQMLYDLEVASQNAAIAESAAAPAIANQASPASEARGNGGGGSGAGGRGPGPGFEQRRTVRRPGR